MLKWHLPAGQRNDAVFPKAQGENRGGEDKWQEDRKHESGIVNDRVVPGVKENAFPVLPDARGLFGEKLGGCPATRIISLSSEGYFATNLWVDLRVGRVRLA